MAKYPYLPLWTDAYLADTRHLSTLEHGAYLLLLFEAWRRPRCTLPDDNKLLARLAGLSTEEWASVRTVIMAFWTLDKRAKEWGQERLQKERKYVARKSAIQSDKAIKRWIKKKKEDATAMPNACRDDAPTPTPTVEVSKVPVGAQSAAPDLKAILFGQAMNYLVGGSGRTEKSVRGMIGRWIRDHGEAGALMAISAAQRQGAVEPVAYTEGALRNGKAAVNGNDWLADWYTGDWDVHDADGSEATGGEADREFLIKDARS